VASSSLKGFVNAPISPTCSEFEAWHLMSGIGFTFADGNKMIIGTTLTELEIQGVWILTDDELSQGWYFDQLSKQ